jgi:hypothetical protein
MIDDVDPPDSRSVYLVAVYAMQTNAHTRVSASVTDIYLHTTTYLAAIKWVLSAFDKLFVHSPPRARINFLIYSRASPV